MMCVLGVGMCSRHVFIMHVITPNSVPFPGSTLSDEPPSHPAVAATANLLLASVLAVEENEKQSKCSFLRIRSTTHILPALPPNQSTTHCGSATTPPYITNLLLAANSTCV